MTTLDELADRCMVAWKKDILRPQLMGIEVTPEEYHTIAQAVLDNEVYEGHPTPMWDAALMRAQIRAGLHPGMRMGTMTIEVRMKVPPDLINIEVKVAKSLTEDSAPS